MGIHGNLTTMNVSDLLQFLATSRKTGTLRFDRGKIFKQIYFQNGLIVGSNSNDPKEYFGQLLIHYGKLNEFQLQAAMEIQRTAGGKLGEILISTNVLSEADVMEILRVRTLEIIYDLFLWEQAQFEFYDDEPSPDDLLRIEVEPTAVIMDGIYRIDEWGRYRTLIPSDRSLLELGSNWTPSASFNKEVRQLLSLIEKKMSVAEICYNMHSSSFHVYGELCNLVSKGMARVAGEAPEPVDDTRDIPHLPETVPQLLEVARTHLAEDDTDSALSVIHRALEKEPKNSDAQSLLLLGEAEFIKQTYASQIPPQSIPKLLIAVDGLADQQLGPQEGFLLSRINGEWDVKSILSICPFREADCLRMIKRLLNDGIIGF